MKDPKIYRETLDQELTSQLLSNSTFLMNAISDLAEAVSNARTILEGNPLSRIVAEHKAHLLGKQGHAQITVDPDGQVMLEVRLQENSPVEEKPSAQEEKSSTEDSKSSLPPITEIRAEAESMGIDWKPYGKSKTKLLQAIKALAEAPKPPAIKIPEVPKAPPGIEDLAKVAQVPKVPPAIEPPKAPETPAVEPPKAPPKPVRVVHAQSQSRLMKLDGDSTLVLDVDLHEISPRKGTPASEPPKRSGRKLSEIASGAEAEIDVDAILSKVLPPTQEE